MKKGGIKGGVTGVGKGIYGLIVKPVAGLIFIKIFDMIDLLNNYLGTIDLVTMTARGVGNMPGTIFRNIFKFKKKNMMKKKVGEEKFEEEK